MVRASAALNDFQALGMKLLGARQPGGRQKARILIGISDCERLMMSAGSEHDYENIGRHRWVLLRASRSGSICLPAIRAHRGSGKALNSPEVSAQLVSGRRLIPHHQ
jgi:hypothetical protein